MCIVNVESMKFGMEVFNVGSHLDATKQLYERSCPSVIPFSQSSSHCIIITFSGVITIDKSDVHAKGQGHRGQTKFWHFQTITPA